MILRFQVLEHEKRPKVIDFEFDSISKALDFLMKGRPLSDFNFDVSQYLLYTRGNIDSIVYQVTLLDKESGKNIALEDLTFEVITRYIDMQEFIEKVCLEGRRSQRIISGLSFITYANSYLQWITNRKSGLDHSYFVMVDFS